MGENWNLPLASVRTVTSASLTLMVTRTPALAAVPSGIITVPEMEPIWLTGSSPGCGGVPLSDSFTVTVWPSWLMLPAAETGVGLKMFEEVTVKFPA